MDMKKLLRGGFVVTPRGSRRADVLLDGEKIAQVGHISPAEDPVPSARFGQKAPAACPADHAKRSGLHFCHGRPLRTFD